MGNTDPLHRTTTGIARLVPLWSRVVGVGIVSILVILVVVLLVGWRNAQPFDDGLVTTGAVVDNRVTTNAEGLERYVAIIEYEVDGASYRLESSSRTINPRQLGEGTEVSYLLSDPAAGRLTENSAALLVFALIAAGFAVAAAIALFWLIPNLARRRIA